MNRGHQADGCRYNLGRVEAVVVHDDLAESARVENPVLVAVQDVAVALIIDSQAITANTFSEQLVVGIRATTNSALLEAVDITI